jgi:hypothetical protein
LIVVSGIGLGSLLRTTGTRIFGLGRNET